MAPAIVSIQPNFAKQGAIVVLTVSGTGFIAGQTALQTSLNLAVTSLKVVDASTIEATVVVGPAGPASIQVETSSGTSPAVSFGVAPSSLDATASLSPTYLAGRIVHPAAPDGVGAGAYLDQPTSLTGCNGKLYFLDTLGLRQVDPATGAVTTLISSHPPYFPLACDGTFLYTSSTAAGALTIEQISLQTLTTVTFSYPRIVANTTGGAESVVIVGGTLYTTDATAGRIWAIDLQTHSRSQLVAFGGPLITTPGGHGSPGSTFYDVGAFWTEGVNLYILRPTSGGMPPPLGFVSSQRDLTRIRMDTGETSVLSTGPFSAVSGDGAVLYLNNPQGIQRFDLTTAGLTQISSLLNVSSIWANQSSLYFSVSFPEGAIGKIDSSSGQPVLIAGDLLRDLDGIGANADFSVYLLPGGMGIHGDSRSIYILEAFSLRSYDLSTGVVSTLATLSLGRGGVWSNGQAVYIGDNRVIRRVDLATKQTVLVAGNPAESGTSDGTTEARFNFIGPMWGDGASLYMTDDIARSIRRLDVATGQVTTVLRDGGIYRGLWGMGRSLYFCDTRMIRRLDLDTLQTETIAGGGPEGSVDGIGTDAKFVRADGLWGNGSSLFVTDAERSIRRIDLTSRRVTTIYNSAEPISPGLYGDGASFYLMEGYSFRRYDPDPSMLTFATGPVASSTADLFHTPSLTALHGEIQFSPGSGAEGVTAIIGYRNADGVLVSETAVPAQPPIRTGRIYSKVAGAVNTGFAISNPNDVAAQVDFYFTDTNGVSTPSGTFTLGPHVQISRFLNESPFSVAGEFEGTFTFSGSVPLAAIAIRGRTNERSEFLMTTLPVIDLTAAISQNPVTIAHFASGGGWRTEVLLVNPSDNALSGVAQFFDDAGTAGTLYPYQLAPRAPFTVVADSSSRAIQKGSVSIIPDANSMTPTPLVDFSYAPNGVTVTETGVPATEGTDFVSYVESSAPSAADPEDPGVAIANTTDQTVNIYLLLLNPNGSQSITLTLASHSQVSKFLSELLPALQRPFAGVLRVFSNANFSVTGLRGTYNARHEFIVSTLTPFMRSSTLPAVLDLPLLTTGGGYSTRLFFTNPTGGWSTGNIRLFNADGSSLKEP